MIISVQPTRSILGTITLPASKSYSIRAFIIAACGGTSIISHASDCDDARVSRFVAQQLGSTVQRGNATTWVVKVGRKKRLPPKINVKESGTALRFLLPLLALDENIVTVVGERTLCGRPNHHLTQVLRQHGVHIRGTGLKESVPIRLMGGKLRPGRICIDGTVSSQFISALLIACPQLSGNSTVVITGKGLVSSEYIMMTQQVLQRSGIQVRARNKRLYSIPGNQCFKGLSLFTIPSDYGLAAFLLGAGALVTSRLTLQGYLPLDLVQADGKIFEFFQRMGVKFRRTTRGLKIAGPFRLTGRTFSLKDCPDLVPIMAIVALFAQGQTRLCNIRHARVKESDRISDLRKELIKIGAQVKEKHNELIINPLPECKYKRNVLLDPHRDHRLAMAFFVLGLKLGARIKDVECVAKSYPDFVKDFKHLGAIVGRK